MPAPDWTDHKAIEKSVEAIKGIVLRQAQVIDQLTARVADLERAEAKQRLDAARCGRRPMKIAP